MCSIYLSLLRDGNRNCIVSEYLSRRGPDYTSSFIKKLGNLHLTITHGLLDLSGAATVQPVLISNDRYILAFNGEIYDTPKHFPSDTLFLASLISSDGVDVFRRLNDIEGTIVLVDTHAKLIYLYMDPFGTKPMFYSFNSYTGELVVSSSPKDVDFISWGKRCVAQPNSIIIFNPFNDEKFKLISPIKKMISREFSYLIWEEIFIESVRRRFCHGTGSSPIVPLSSGHDSGAICLALDILGIQYDSISIRGNEVSSIIASRVKRKNGGKHYDLGDLTTKESKKYLDLFDRNIGRNYFMSHQDGPDGYREMIKDGGLVALCKVADFSKSNGYNVTLSGSCGDELMTDYGYNGKKIYHHSEFSGLFPDNLLEIFPWRKFFYDSQRSYLEKEEFVLGIFGMEGRYPYLSWELNEVAISEPGNNRNALYKSLQSNFFQKHQYPFVMNKVGFSPVGMSSLKKIAHSLKSRITKIS